MHRRPRYVSVHHSLETLMSIQHTWRCAGTVILHGVALCLPCCCIETLRTPSWCVARSAIKYIALEALIMRVSMRHLAL